MTARASSSGGAQRRAGVSGPALLAQTARVGVVAQLLALIAPALAGVFGPPALAAAVDGVWPLAGALAVPAALFALTGLLWRPRPRDVRAIEALATVAVLFMLASACAAPAFMALGMAPVAAGFEAVSGFTATGMSAAQGAEVWPLSAHFLRAWLQWCGGLAFLASALALIVGPGAVAQRLGRAGTEVGGADDPLASTRTRARAALTVYVALTMAAALPAALLASSVWDGVLLALTAVATGGFSPADDSLAREGRALQWVLMTACLLGAISFSLLARSARDPLALWRDPALRVTGVLLGLGLVIVAASVGWASGRATDGALTVVSALSTGGFSPSDTGAFPPAALIALVVLMVVGGDVGSTAGGIKSARVAVGAAAVRTTLLRARAAPGAVTPLRALDHRFGAGELTGMMALACLYGATALAVWIGLALLGLPALPALFDAVSALSNVGLSAGVAGPDAPTAAKLMLMAAMLLGRLEFFAVILALRPSTWAAQAS